MTSLSDAINTTIQHLQDVAYDLFARADAFFNVNEEMSNATYAAGNVYLDQAADLYAVTQSQAREIETTPLSQWLEESTPSGYEGGIVGDGTSYDASGDYPVGY